MTKSYDLTKSPTPPATLDEQTATALSIVIHNHIEAMQVWERKLRTPYMPTTRRHFSVVPDYDKPTLNTLIHIIVSSQTFVREFKRIATEAAARMEKEGEES